MGLKEADLLLKNYNFIKTYWLKVVGYGFPIFCMSSDLAKLHLFKVFKEYLNRAIPMFCVMSDLDATNRAIVEKVHLKCIDFFE